MTDPQAVRKDLIELVHTALDAASRPDELLDCARAAAVLEDTALIRQVSDRLADQIEEASEGSSAWRLQMQQSKHETWAQTGHKARILAEAWSVVSAALAGSEPAAADPTPPGSQASGGTEPPNYDQP